MVEVYGHCRVAYVQHTSQEAVTVLVLQGNNGTHNDVFVIKLAVDRKYLLVQIAHTGLYKLTIRLLRGKDKIEVVAHGQINDGSLEIFQRSTKPAKEYERFAILGFFNQFGTVFTHIIELIGHADVLIQVLFHIFFVSIGF